jgi:16S rRNA (guanine527-N7)-methyltransferase
MRTSPQLNSALANALAADRARALELTPVSRETAERLDRFVSLLLEWQQRLNLIAPSTAKRLWTRHIADSLQLITLAPLGRTWIDVGSGAGFPGIVIACALADEPEACINLVESIRKKAAFLQAAQQDGTLPVVVHAQRVEDFGSRFCGSADVVCARAVAPLNRLLRLIYPLVRETRALALLPKGQSAERELDQASRSWALDATLVPSRTDPAGRIIVIRGLSPRADEP